MSEAEDLLIILLAAVPSDFGKELPGPLDVAFRKLAKLYAESDAAGRAAIRALVPEGTAYSLLRYSLRMSTIAARTGDESALFDALIAHALEELEADPLENISLLCVVHHVAKNLGLDPDALFTRAAALASREGAQELRNFTARKEPFKSLPSRYIEVQTPAGVSYEERPPLWASPKPEPARRARKKKE